MNKRTSVLEWPFVHSAEAALCRQSVAKKLFDWKVYLLPPNAVSHYHHYDNMAKVMGFNNYDEMHSGWNEEVAEALRALDGPNGYTIAKAMEARRRK